jgi:hypothetical protein
VNFIDFKNQVNPEAILPYSVLAVFCYAQCSVLAKNAVSILLPFMDFPLAVQRCFLMLNFCQFGFRLWRQGDGMATDIAVNKLILLAINTSARFYQ